MPEPGRPRRSRGEISGPPADQAARDYAVDPRHNVVLEASAGTGKTSVLVRRYLALLSVGVDPRHILAITFTRKAAAEMRDRIVGELRRQSAESADGRRRWRELRDRLGDIAISTIDAFCLSLLGEFPLEADLDPGFTVADETERAMLYESTVDQVLRFARGRAATAEGIRDLLAKVPERRLVRSLQHLLERRVVAGPAFARLLSRAPSSDSTGAALEDAAARIAAALAAAPGGPGALARDRPGGDPRFDLLEADLNILLGPRSDAVTVRAALDHLRDYFVTQDGHPRTRLAGVVKAAFPSDASWRRHVRAFVQVAPVVAEALNGLDRETNLALARAVQVLHAVAVRAYRDGLQQRDVLDFTESLVRTVALLEQMDEFSQSRYRLQSRYQHVLVDEFQDTSRLQWRLVSLLVEAWGEGRGLADEAGIPPTVFVVGDRKQSIYRFRDADVTLLDEAGRFIERLRAEGSPRRAISMSFRSRPEILAFANDICAGMERRSSRADRFRFDQQDRFTVDGAESERLPTPALGLILAATDEEAASLAADEVARLIDHAEVRDRDTGLRRRTRPGDVAILFRARESHRPIERALEARTIPTYVYKGLGFFESEEIQDLSALVRFLARPSSPLRAAALLRSRLVRLSDPGLLALAHDLPAAMLDTTAPVGWEALGEDDRQVLTLVRHAVPGWVARVDVVPPAELLDEILGQTAYGWELSGARAPQARENVKKFRSLVRRLQNRGYLTMARLARHLDRLSAGDESNAIVDAADAVNLMTIHAAKGLEFPIVFVVNLERGSGEGRGAFRVLPDDGTGEPAVAVAGDPSNTSTGEREANLEETKRLLYVALTRARDHLFLSCCVKDEGFHPARGSLGEVLPRSFQSFLGGTRATLDEPAEAVWRPDGGTRHRFTLRRT